MLMVIPLCSLVTQEENLAAKGSDMTTRMPHYGRWRENCLGENTGWQGGMAYRLVYSRLYESLGRLSVIHCQVKVSGEHLTSPVTHNLKHQC